MISKNVTILNKELVLANLVKATRKNTIPKFALAFIILVLGIVVMVTGITTNNTLYTILGAFFVACSIFYFVLAIITFIRAPKDLLKSNPELLEGDISFNYLFKEGSIEVTSLSKNNKKKINKYPYDQLKKIFEYKDRYEILLKESQILFVLKDGFKEEKSEEIFKYNLEKNKKQIKSKIKEMD